MVFEHLEMYLYDELVLLDENKLVMEDDSMPYMISEKIFNLYSKYTCQMFHCVKFLKKIAQKKIYRKSQ